jgi:hypothetical protein
MKTIAVKVNDDFHTEIKEKLQRQGKDLKSLVTEFLLTYLENDD